MHAWQEFDDGKSRADPPQPPTLRVPADGITLKAIQCHWDEPEDGGDEIFK